jgi:RimJ/RimL family protein N-acetyltransferase
LEPFDANVHLDGLFEAVGGEVHAALWTYTPNGPYLDKQSFLNFYSNMNHHAERSLEWKTMVVRRVSDSKILGMESFMRIRPEHGSVEVGSVLFGDEMRRSAYSTEATFLCIKHAFEGIHPSNAHCSKHSKT